MSTNESINHTFSIAPMLDLTDKHCRYFHRLISSHSLLYTEMVTTGALLNGDKKRFLDYSDKEKPVVFQLGGSDPDSLSQCAEIVESYGYTELNLNVGCPSDRVQNGRFGACLMAEPELVASCITAMKSNTSLPVTVKCRIGIDNQDSYENLVNFIETTAESGCETFIIHARKAWLKGLSPKQNREIPELKYETVFQLKQDFSELTIILNGGIVSVDQSMKLLNHVDGIMVGREAYQNPYFLAEVDSLLFNSNKGIKSRLQIIQELIPYIQDQLEKGVRLHSITRHILGLFHGVPGAKIWRRTLSTEGVKKDADERVIFEALNLMGL